MLPASFTPDLLRQLELLKIRSRRSFLGTRQGGHVSLKRGHGIEFADYRKYEPGDNPRDIDWGVYARSERLYVKTFREEQDLKVFMLIDTSASMLVPPGDRKWEKACEIAMALAYVALMEQDSVSVVAPGTFYSPSYCGGRAIHQLGNRLLSLKPDARKDPLSSMRAAISRVRYPGVAILISDFLMPFAFIREIFNGLRARNMDITAVQVLGPGEIEPLTGIESARAVDSETGEEIEITMDQDARNHYGLLLMDHNQRLQDFLAESRIAYCLALSRQDLGEFLLDNLARTGLLK